MAGFLKHSPTPRLVPQGSTETDARRGNTLGLSNYREGVKMGNELVRGGGIRGLRLYEVACRRCGHRVWILRRSVAGCTCGGTKEPLTMKRTGKSEFARKL